MCSCSCFFTEILEGGVQIINNKYLNYGPWIFWQDIIRDSSAPIDIQFNGDRGQCQDGPIKGITKLSLDCHFLLNTFFLSVSSSVFLSQDHATNHVEFTAGGQMWTSVRSVSTQLFQSFSLHLLLSSSSFFLFTECLNSQRLREMHKQRYSTVMHIVDFCSTHFSCVFQWLRRCVRHNVVAAVLGQAPGTAVTQSVQQDVKAPWMWTAL